MRLRDGRTTLGPKAGALDACADDASPGPGGLFLEPQCTPALGWWAGHALVAPIVPLRSECAVTGVQLHPEGVAVVRGAVCRTE